MLKQLLIIIICQVIELCLANSALNIYCCLICGEAHTMCRYNSSIPGKACKGYITSELRPLDKLKILNMHNKLRQQIALRANEEFPAAGDMRELEWDDQLEDIATRWNKQCLFYNYDECRTTPGYEEVGQNIGFKRAMKQRGTAEGIIQRWFNENAYIPRLYLYRLVNTTYYISKGLRSKLPSNITYSDFGHFTQLVWSRTHKVGCSVIRQRIPPFFSTTLVCNYYPAGNYLYHPVYTPGEACTKCPDGTTCSKRHPGLCTEFTFECEPNVLYPLFCNGIQVKFLRSKSELILVVLIIAFFNEV